MAKTIRREVQLKPEHQAMVKALISLYNLKTDSQALIRALTMAAKAYPVLMSEKNKLEESLSKLQSDYDKLKLLASNYVASHDNLSRHIDPVSHLINII